MGHANEVSARHRDLRSAGATDHTPAIQVPPHGYQVVNPYLTVSDVPALIEFLQHTFDAVVTERIMQPDGHVEHAEIRIGESLLMIGPPQVDSLIFAGEHARPGTFYVFVGDVDITYHKAMEHGANSYMLPTDMFYGDRVAAVVDTNDNVWWIATRKAALSRRQLQARADEHWHGRRGRPAAE